MNRQGLKDIRDLKDAYKHKIESLRKQALASGATAPIPHSEGPGGLAFPPGTASTSTAIHRASPKHSENINVNPTRPKNPLLLSRCLQNRGSFEQRNRSNLASTTCIKGELNPLHHPLDSIFLHSPQRAKTSPIHPSPPTRKPRRRNPFSSMGVPRRAHCQHPLHAPGRVQTEGRVCITAHDHLIAYGALGEQGFGVGTRDGDGQEGCQC